VKSWVDCFTQEIQEKFRDKILIAGLASVQKGKILSRPADAGCADTVSQILSQVKARGDGALIEYARKFDGAGADYAIRVPESEIERALETCPKDLLWAMGLAKKNIEAYAKACMPKPVAFNGKDAKISRKIVPLESAGIYAPGGRAAYPSTVLMCAIPAKTAGVEKVVLCSPFPVQDSILAAAALCGIKDVFAIGGAQAIAAMAYGTKTVPKVRIIAGPGNQYVTEAKRQARNSGTAIDMLAGPTEVMIIADKGADIGLVAADMLAQLEHGPDSTAIAIVEKGMEKGLANEIAAQAATLNRAQILEKSISNCWIVAAGKGDYEGMADLANAYAPEHLELQTRNNARLLKLVKNAGAIFVGEKSCEAFGDYCAGSNHVLPTGGSAAVSSALGVETFLKRIEVVEVKKTGRLAKCAGIIADAEGLGAHAKSARKRIGRKSG